MLKLVHVTDPHLLPEGELLLGMDPAARFQQVMHSVSRRHGDADLLVISGDLTDRGDIVSYRLLRDCLKEVPISARLLLGNHDKRGNFRAVFPEVGIAPGGYVQAVDDLGDVRLVHLDTLAEGRLLPGQRRAVGRLDEDQLAWLKEQLAGAYGRRVIIFMHHPPRSVHAPAFDDILLADRDRFWSVVQDAGNVEHIAFGHTHVTATGRWGPVSFSCNRGTCHKIALNLDDRRIDWVDGDATYDVILVDEAITVHHVDRVGPVAVTGFEIPTDDGSPTVIQQPTVATSVYI